MTAAASMPDDRGVPTGLLVAGGAAVGGPVGDDLGSAEAGASGGPVLPSLRSHRSPHPPTTDPTAPPVALALDEAAVAELRDLVVQLSSRFLALFAGVVTPENLAVVAAAAAASPRVPAAVPVLHLRLTADRARTLADALDLWADRVERR